MNLVDLTKTSFGWIMEAMGPWTPCAYHALLVARSIRERTGSFSMLFGGSVAETMVLLVQSRFQNKVWYCWKQTPSDTTPLIKLNVKKRPQWTCEIPIITYPWRNTKISESKMNQTNPSLGEPPHSRQNTCQIAPASDLHVPFLVPFGRLWESIFVVTRQPWIRILSLFRTRIKWTLSLIWFYMDYICWLFIQSFTYTSADCVQSWHLCVPSLLRFGALQSSRCVCDDGSGRFWPTAPGRRSNEGRGLYVDRGEL